MSITFRAKELELNVSNVNAVYILNILGFEQVACDESNEGWINPTAFIMEPQRLIDACDLVLNGLASLPGLDSELPATESRGENGARIIDCGRREGYLQDRITKLRAIAVEARDNGIIVEAC